MTTKPCKDILLNDGIQNSSLMNQSVNQLRKLLSHEYVVALDTNILSALEKEIEPCWFSQFVEMCEVGVKFSIPDVCIGEHLESYDQPPSDMKEKWERMASRLNAFIWQDFPCLPMRGAIYELVGIQQKDDGADCDHDQFSCEISKMLYEYFINYDSSPYNKTEYRERFKKEVAKARSHWGELIASLRKDRIWEPEQLTKCLMEYLTEQNKSQLSNQKISQLTREFKEIRKEQLCKLMLLSYQRDFPSVDIVNRLTLPYRFAIEHASDLEYDPLTEHCRYRGRRVKPKNDGVDYQILLLTMASINICSNDESFFHRVRDLNHTKSCCCYTPDCLGGGWVSDKKALFEKLLRVDVPMEMG